MQGAYILMLHFPKVHKSIILSHMAEGLNNPGGISRPDIEQSVKGTTDSDPFVIQEASVQQFRHFLFFMLGT